MDKFEYKVKAEEIKTLAAEKKYKEAMEIAETIDWTRVRSVMMLNIVAEIYKINRRYEESRELLFIANERNPQSRAVLYALCEVSIKMEDVIQAIEFYKEFVQAAPKDSGRYILQYKLYEAQEVSLEERISVLEEFKRKDYREKWAYELAYLYHRIGLTTRCVEECDEIILWFGEGKYVRKAMELKMLHEPLTPAQQDKYERRKKKKSSFDITEKNDVFADDMDIQVKTVDTGKFSTINLQQELAASMQELLGETSFQDSFDSLPTQVYEDTYSMEEYPDDTFATEGYADNNYVENSYEGDSYEAGAYEEESYQETSYDAIENEENVEIEHGYHEGAYVEENYVENTYVEEYEQETEFEETEVEEVTNDSNEMELEESELDYQYEETVVEEYPIQEEIEDKPVREVFFEDGATGEIKPITLEQLGVNTFDTLLSQEYDGQISLVVPEEEQIEKQITGQLSIQDVLIEWERMKKENEEKRKEEVRQRVLDQTNDMFAEFDAATREDILAQLNELAQQEVTNQEGTELQEDNSEEFDLEELDAEEMEEDYGEVEEIEEIEEPEDLLDEDIFDKEHDEFAGDEEVFEEKEIFEAGEVVEADVSYQDENEVDKESNVEHISRKMKSHAYVEDREFTEEEFALFGSFINTKEMKLQIIDAIDKITLAPYTGNAVVTGEEIGKNFDLAKNLLKEVKVIDHNFSGKVAKISASSLNTLEIPSTLERLDNGALLIEQAGAMTMETVNHLVETLDKDSFGIIVVLEDNKTDIEKLFARNTILNQYFNIRIDIAELDNDSLVAHGKEYANELEYSIDQLGILALHTRIAERQTSEHDVTPKEVEEIVQEAIQRVNKKNVGHFMDILLAKRYDEEDMIILREKDFIY